MLATFIQERNREKMNSQHNSEMRAIDLKRDALFPCQNGEQFCMLREVSSSDLSSASCLMQQTHIACQNVTGESIL